MAPSTRRTENVESQRKPVILDDPPKSKHQQKIQRVVVRAAPTNPNNVTQIKKPKKAEKGPKRVHDYKECQICVETKTLTLGFKNQKIENICPHFRDICAACVRKMVKAKVIGRKLDDAVLACPFVDCKCALDMASIKQIVSKGTFNE